MKSNVGIILPFQNGDLLTATSVLKYRDELWPNSNIVWFCDESHKDLLKFQDVEIRNFPHGWEISEQDMIGKYAERIKKDKEDDMPDWEDLSLVKNSHNRLNQEIKHKFNSVNDLKEAYFPAPWMMTMQQRTGLLYNNISKVVFGVNLLWEWHPVLTVTEEEKEKINKWFPPNDKKIIAIESYCGSGQSIITDGMIRETMRMCIEQFGECYFIFVSHKYLHLNPEFPQDFLNDKDIFFAGNWTVRQCAYVVACCDLLVSTSSGVSVAASCWQFKDSCPPIIQFCGSTQCSTQAIATSYFQLITHDEKPFHIAQQEYFDELQSILNQIK